MIIFLVQSLIIFDNFNLSIISTDALTAKLTWCNKEAYTFPELCFILLVQGF